MPCFHLPTKMDKKIAKTKRFLISPAASYVYQCIRKFPKTHRTHKPVMKCIAHLQCDVILQIVHVLAKDHHIVIAFYGHPPAGIAVHDHKNQLQRMIVFQSTHDSERKVSNMPGW